MRHFLWYNSDGSLRGVHRYSGGWPVEVDLRDDSSDHPAVQRIRARMSTEEEFEGFTEFECMCPSEAFMCSCAHNILHDHYFDGKSVSVKPALVVELSGIEVEYGPVFDGRHQDLTPGSDVTLVLKAAVPDGHSVPVANSTIGTPLFDGPTSLTFADGVSESLVLRVPDQGLSGIVGGQSSLVRRFVVAVRGWS